MATIDLTPSRITDSNYIWTNLADIYSDNNQYVVCPSGVSTPIFLEFYSGNHSNSVIPMDSIINGVQVFYAAKVSGSTSAQLNFSYYLTEYRTPVSSALTTAAFSTTEVSSSVGGSSNTFSFSLKWIDLNSIVNGKAVGNPWFGLYVQPASAYDSQILIDHIYLRIHYTTYSYLIGSRTKFHTGRPDLGYDVYTGSAEVSSYITRRQNSSANINQVRSNDLNILGDSLYNIESAILSPAGANVTTLDLKSTYVFSITVSATYSSNDPFRDVIVYLRKNYNNTLYSVSTNISTSYRTSMPSLSGGIHCPFSSAIGWFTNGASAYPMFTTVSAFRAYQRPGGSLDYAIAISALASGIGAVSDYDSYADTTTAYQGYIGSRYIPPMATWPVSGNVHFKIFAMGRR